MNATTDQSDHLSVSDKYKNEEVTSSYGYRSGYTPNRDQSVDAIISDIEQRTKVLDSIFNCGTTFDANRIVRAHKVCPSWVEKFFPQFDWRHVAPTYAEAVVNVLDAIKQARNGKFHNYHDGQINDQRLRQSTKTEAVFAKLGDEQKDHDILVVAAQFGLRHRGRSTRRVREIMQANEFGLGAFAVGIMILTHPERLSYFDDLWIDCGGDELDCPGAVGTFSCAPCFSFNVKGGQVEFGSRWYNLSDDEFGSVSGFTPPD